MNQGIDKLRIPAKHLEALWIDYENRVAELDRRVGLSRVNTHELLHDYRKTIINKVADIILLAQKEIADGRH